MDPTDPDPEHGCGVNSWEHHCNKGWASKEQQYGSKDQIVFWELPSRVAGGEHMTIIQQYTNNSYKSSAVNNS
jgi:hypothetical protein